MQRGKIPLALFTLKTAIGIYDDLGQMGDHQFLRHFSPIGHFIQRTDKTGRDVVFVHGDRIIERIKKAFDLFLGGIPRIRFVEAEAHAKKPQRVIP